VISFKLDLVLDDLFVRREKSFMQPAYVSEADDTDAPGASKAARLSELGFEG